MHRLIGPAISAIDTLLHEPLHDPSQYLIWMHLFGKDSQITTCLEDLEKLTRSTGIFSDINTALWDRITQNV